MAALTLPSGLTGLYYMNRCYRIKTRPFWNHWQVGTAFFGNMFSLGALVCALLLGLAAEGLGHLVHARAMGAAEHEGGASHYVQSSTFGKTFILRNALIGANLLLVAGLLVAQLVGIDSLWLLAAGCWLGAGLVLLACCLISRALFYVLVIPTTIPGAFFWKNKGFEQHARDIGLAHMPQVGVVPLSH